MTAEELAGVREVSVRAGYRDVQALIAAGVQAYGEAGERAATSRSTATAAADGADGA